MTPPSPPVVHEDLTVSRTGAPAGQVPSVPGQPVPLQQVPGQQVPLQQGTGPLAPAAPPVPAQGTPAAGRSAVPAARRPAPRTPGPGGPRRYRLRGRHIREHRMVRVGLALAAADIAVADDLLVLQVLRLQPLADLDPAQVCALSALPPSIVASSLDRLVRSGLARDCLVDGRVRFGLP